MADRLLTRQQVEERCGLSRSTIYRKMREQPPTFPTPIKISQRAVRWMESEVAEWLAPRPRATGDFPRSEHGGAVRPGRSNPTREVWARTGHP